MIKSDFGKTTVKGNKALLMAELSNLIYSLLKTKVFTKKEIKNFVKDGMKTKEKIEKDFNKKYKNGISTSKMQKIMTNIIGARKSGLINEKIMLNLK